MRLATVMGLVQEHPLLSSLIVKSCKTPQTTTKLKIINTWFRSIHILIERQAVRGYLSGEGF